MSNVFRKVNHELVFIIAVCLCDDELREYYLLHVFLIIFLAGVVGFHCLPACTAVLLLLFKAIILHTFAVI